MHLEILIEDASGKILVGHVMGKICSYEINDLTYRIIEYKGLGGLPKNLNKDTDPKKKSLLDKLPQILRGYGKSLDENSAVMVIVDSDKRDCKKFKAELVSVLNTCSIAPKTVFCIAIEEMEAWLLGDREAIKMAYPNCKNQALSAYNQDSVCDTWEVLADAICKEKLSVLKKKGFPEIGIKKCEWADKIAPYIDIERNVSPSFAYFIRKVRELAVHG